MVTFGKSTFETPRSMESCKERVCVEWILLQIKPNKLLIENSSLQLRVKNGESISELCG